MKALSNSQRRKGRSANRSSLTVTVMVALLALLLTAGCAQSPPAQQATEDQQQQDEELQKQIDKLEKQKAAEEKEDLQNQIDQLKKEQEEQAKKQEEQNQEPQIVIENNENIASAPAQAPEGVVAVSPDVSTSTDLEAGALNAAANYYAAVEAGDYTYTYNALSAADQGYYTYDEWQNANTALDSAASEFEVFRALVDSPNTAMVEGGYPHVADVGVTIYYPDGSTGTRYTFFVYEGGVWKHWLTSEETELFDSVLSASATPTAASATPSKDKSSGSSGGADSDLDRMREAAMGTARQYFNDLQTGHYNWAYNLLSDPDKWTYTQDEFVSAQDTIGADQSTYEVVSAEWLGDAGLNDTAFDVKVDITVPTGEVVTKHYWFNAPSKHPVAMEMGYHSLNGEEIEIINGALGR